MLKSWSDAFCAVCSGGHLEFARWQYGFEYVVLPSEGLWRFDTKMLDVAFSMSCLHNHLHVVRWLMSITSEM